MITQIGKHRVKCGNLIDGIDDLMAGETADLFYSDPPWGAGNLRYWETMRIKNTGAAERRDVGLNDFVGKFFDIAVKHTKNVVIVEYGIDWEQAVISAASSAGLRHEITVGTQYKSGSTLRPMSVHVFSKHGVALPASYGQEVAGTHGFKTVLSAAAPFLVQDGIILDPCCGLGYSGRLAMQAGMRFRGNELNAARLAKCIRCLK